jgi:CBS domain-containing protein
MNLKDVLAAKGRHRAVTVSAKSSIADAIRTMNAEKVGSVMVPDAEGCPVGIFTERDVVRLYADGDRDFDKLPVEARMTCSLVLGRLSMPVDEALGLMTERRFRHLPVVEDGKLLGLVSIGDLVKVKLNEAAQEAQALRAYITS